MHAPRALDAPRIDRGEHHIKELVFVVVVGAYETLKSRDMQQEVITADTIVHARGRRPHLRTQTTNLCVLIEKLREDA
jgi:hypothetical protein